MVGIGLPPAPAAVVVLHLAEPLHARRHHAVERRQALGRRELELRERPRDQQVGQEARERLLGAAVGIAGEEIERAEQRPGHRRRERHRDRCAPPDSRPAGTVTGRGGLARAGDRAADAGLAPDAVGHDGHRQLDRVGVAVGGRRRGDARGADGAGARTASRRAARRRRRAMPAEGRGAPAGVSRPAGGHRHRRRCGLGDGSCGRCVGQHDVVALGEEPRRDDPDDQVLGGRRARDGGAGARVRGDGPRRQPPRGQRVGVLHRDLGLARGVGDEVAEPVDGVGEVLAHLRLRRLVALEVGQRERPAPPRRRAAAGRGPE